MKKSYIIHGQFWFIGADEEILFASFAFIINLYFNCHKLL